MLYQKISCLYLYVFNMPKATNKWFLHPVQPGTMVTHELSYDLRVFFACADVSCRTCSTGTDAHVTCNTGTDSHVTCNTGKTDTDSRETLLLIRIRM